MLNQLLSTQVQTNRSLGGGSVPSLPLSSLSSPLLSSFFSPFFLVPSVPITITAVLT